MYGKAEIEPDMTQKKSIYFLSIIAVSIAIISIFMATEFTFIQKKYMIAFHRSGLVGTYYKNGKLNGEIELYENGKITRKATFKNGLINGWAIYYYPNGLVKRKYFAKNDIKDGIEYSYFEDGKINIKRTYKDGKKEGSEIIYYRNGKVDRTLFYKNNNANGIEHAYYEDGNLKYTRNWLNSKPYGDFYYYFKNKIISLYQTYDILGNRFYLIRYDSFGNVTKRLGYMFSAQTYTKVKDSIILLQTRHTYKSINDLYVTIAHPPEVTGKITILINNNDRADFILLDKNTNYIKKAFDHKGTYHIEILVSFISDDLSSDKTSGELTIKKE